MLGFIAGADIAGFHPELCPLIFSTPDELNKLPLAATPKPLLAPLNKALSQLDFLTELAFDKY